MSIYSIYKWTNQINGKVYIGLTNNAEGRKYSHIWAANNGSTLPIHQAIRKYGEENFTFEVILSVFNKDDLGDFERHFIAEYNCCRLDGNVNGYNLTRGGEGFDSDQAKALIARRTAEGTNPWAGELGSAHSKALAKRRMEEGTHHFQDTEWQAKNTAKSRQRVADGTHHWVGEEWSKIVSQQNKDRAARGEHVWQSDAHKQKIKAMIASGEHYIGKKAKCCHCGKEANLHNINKWHNANCKLNPLCDRTALDLEKKKAAETRKLKKADGAYDKKISCPHCLLSGSENNMKRYHFDNCKKK